MKRSRRIALIACGILPVCVVAAAWFVPRLLNWTAYRVQVEALASSALGHDVQINGPIRVELLPHPVLTADYVRVNDAQGGISVGVRELRLRTSIAALLTGRIQPRELTLRRPEIRIPAALSAPPALRDWLNATTTHIANGTLYAGDVVITNINATAEADPATHTLGLRGNASLNGAPFEYATRLSSPDEMGASMLDASASAPQTGNARIAYTGTLASTGALNGQVTASGTDLSLLLDAPTIAFQIQGNVQGSTGRIDMQPLSIQLGPDRLQGQLTLALSPTPRLGLTLTTPQIDATSWLAAQPFTGNTYLPVSADLTIGTMTIHNRLIQNLHLIVNTDGTDLQIPQASALLPGNTQIDLQQVTRIAAGAPAFSGQIRINAPTLRTTLDGLGLAQFAIPPEALRQAQIEGRFSASPDALTLAGLSGTLDDNDLQGSISIRQNGSRQMVAADLKFSQVPTVSWIQALPAQPQWPQDIDVSMHLDVTQMQINGQVFRNTELQAALDTTGLRITRFSTHPGDGEINLTGTYGRDSQAIDITASLALPEAAAIPALLPDTWRNSTLLQTLSAQAPATVRNAPVSLQIQATGSRTAPALQLRASLDDLRLDGRISIMPAPDAANTPSITGTLTLRHPGMPRLVTLLTGAAPRNDCPPSRACVPATEAPPPWAWLGDGSLSLVTQFAVTPDGITAPYIALSAGELRLHGDLALTSGERTALRGSLNVETMPPPDQLPVSPALLATLDSDITLHIETLLANRAPGLTDIDATLKGRRDSLDLTVQSARFPQGGMLTGALTVTPSTTPPVLSASATLQQVDLVSGLAGFDLGITGIADATLQLQSSGYSRQALLAALSGSADVTVQTGTLTGLSLADLSSAAVRRPRAAAEAAIRQALSEGTSSFSRLNSQIAIANGVAAYQAASINTDHGHIGVNGSADLSRGTTETRLLISPNLPDPPEIALTLTGPLSALQRRVDLSGFARWFRQQ